MVLHVGKTLYAWLNMTFAGFGAKHKRRDIKITQVYDTYHNLQLNPFPPSAFKQNFFVKIKYTHIFPQDEKHALVGPRGQFSRKC